MLTTTMRFLTSLQFDGPYWPQEVTDVLLCVQHAEDFSLFRLPVLWQQETVWLWGMTWWVQTDRDVPGWGSGPGPCAAGQTHSRLWRPVCSEGVYGRSAWRTEGRSHSLGCTSSPVRSTSSADHNSQLHRDTDILLYTCFYCFACSVTLSFTLHQKRM